MYNAILLVVPAQVLLILNVLLAVMPVSLQEVILVTVVEVIGLIPLLVAFALLVAPLVQIALLAILVILMLLQLLLLVMVAQQVLLGALSSVSVQKIQVVTQIALLVAQPLAIPTTVKAAETMEATVTTQLCRLDRVTAKMVGILILEMQLAEDVTIHVKHVTEELVQIVLPA